MRYFSNWKNFKTLSFGLFSTLFFLWVYFHTEQFIPSEFKDTFFKAFIGYGFLHALIFVNTETRNKLYNAKFIPFVVRMLIFTAISLFVFYFILAKIDPLGETAYSLFKSLPWWLAASHMLIFATIESTVWQGWLDDKLGRPVSALTAGVFHWGIWPGSAFIVIISAGLLFAFFTLVHLFFRSDKNDLAPVIGVHTGFNFVKLGLLLSPLK